MYYVFLIVYPPRGAWRTARVLEVRNDHRAPGRRAAAIIALAKVRGGRMFSGISPAGPQTCGPRSPVWPVTRGVVLVAARARDRRRALFVERRLSEYSYLYNTHS